MDTLSFWDLPSEMKETLGVCVCVYVYEEGLKPGGTLWATISGMEMKNQTMQFCFEIETCFSDLSLNFKL